MTIDTVKKAEYLLNALCEELRRQGYGLHVATAERNCCADVVVGTVMAAVDVPPYPPPIVLIELQDADVEVQRPVLCIMDSGISEGMQKAITEYLASLDIENGVSFKLTSP